MLSKLLSWFVLSLFLLVPLSSPLLPAAGSVTACVLEYVPMLVKECGCVHLILTHISGAGWRPPSLYKSFIHLWIHSSLLLLCTLFLRGLHCPPFTSPFSPRGHQAPSSSSPPQAKPRLTSSHISLYSPWKKSRGIYTRVGLPGHRAHACFILLILLNSAGLLCRAASQLTQGGGPGHASFIFSRSSPGRRGRG